MLLSQRKMHACNMKWKKEEQMKNILLIKLIPLEMQAGMLKASAGKMNEKDKHDFEKRINQYIKDLEKCITMLNN